MEENLKKQKLSLLFKSFIKSKVLLYLVLFLFLYRVFFVLIFFNFSESVFFADITKSSLVNMLNQTRQSLGLEVLQESKDLDNAAVLKAQDMVKNGYFSHTSPSGITPWHWFYEAGYDYKYAGENLAIGFYDSGEVFNAWMDSSSHKENMVNPFYSEVGTAVLSGFGENDAVIVVQLFGYPKSTAMSKDSEINQTELIETPVLSAENEVITENPVTQESQENSTQDAKVLSSSASIEKYEKGASGNFYLKFLNFILYGNDLVFGRLIYALVLILSGILAYILILDYNNSFVDKSLVLRSAILIGLLAGSIIINKDLITLIIPHRVII
jgi:hypothetical protein